MIRQIFGPVAIVLGMRVLTGSHDHLRPDLDDYAWPTATRHIITSVFGEFRETHFHAGIDISTHDQTGEPVTAARSGYISRILVSPNGYGKMLTLRHADGYSTNYAHLSRFADAVEALVRREQRRLGYYPIELNCVPYQFPVSKGELIAYSGETGTGSAHLHFEMRDEQGDAFNPMLSPGFVIEDTVPPIVHGISFVPVGPFSLVNNGWEPVVSRVRRSGTGGYACSQAVRVRGDLGVAIDARDGSNGTSFLHGIYTLRLFVDSKELQTIRFDRVPVHDGQTIRLTYLKRARRGGNFQKLFVDTPHRIDIYSPDSLGSGVIHGESLPEGRHEFSVVAQDSRANTSTTRGEFMVVHNPTVGAAGSGPGSAPPQVRLEDANGFVRVIVRHPAGIPGVDGEVTEGGTVRRISFERVSAGLTLGSFVPLMGFGGNRLVTVRVPMPEGTQSATASWDCYPIVPGVAGSYTLDGGNLRIDFGAEAVFAPLFLRIWKDESGEGPVYRFEPEDAILNEGLTVTLTRSMGSSKEGIYIRPGGHWSLLSRAHPDTGGTIIAKMHGFLGDIALKTDTRPPVIHALRIEKRSDRKPVISFRYRDDVSGIEYQQVKAYIDSIMVIPEIDGEHRRVLCTPDTPLERGSHQLSIRLTDRMGNAAFLERAFNVR